MTSAGANAAIARARATVCASDAEPRSFVTATPVRPSTIVRTRTVVSALARFWWTALCVKRVKPLALLVTIASHASPPARSRIVRARATRSDSRIVADPDAHVAKACGRRGLRGAPRLHRLAFSAIRCAPGDPRMLVGHGIAAIPKLWRHAGIRGIFTMRVFLPPLISQPI